MELNVYDFANHCFSDEKFNSCGVPSDEKVWLDKLNIVYETDEYGNVCGGGKDMADFYNAVITLKRLNDKVKGR